jgi:hypothetical protein
VFERVSIKSRFVGPLPGPFLAYLQEDGIVLPDTAQHLTAIVSTSPLHIVYIYIYFIYIYILYIYI